MSVFSGEPLPLAPNLKGALKKYGNAYLAAAAVGISASATSDHDSSELTQFHNKLLDYLRRLSSKIDSPIFNPQGGGGSVSMIMLYMDADQGISTAWETLLWGGLIRRDAGFEYNAGVITVTAPGTFLLFFDTAIGDDLFAYETSVLLDSGANSLAYGFGGSVTGAEIQDIGSISNNVPIQLSAGQSVEIQARANGATDILAKGSRLTMIRLDSGFISTGGESGGGGKDVPHTPDITSPL